MIKLDTLRTIKVLNFLEQVIRFLSGEFEFRIKLGEVDSKEISTINLPDTNIAAFFETIGSAMLYHG